MITPVPIDTQETLAIIGVLAGAWIALSVGLACLIDFLAQRRPRNSVQRRRHF